jgi:enoyl-CoA hydratase/carnithine racemase
MSQPVLLERRDEIALLTLNGPSTRNAFGREMQLELLRLLEQTAADDSCRALVLTGADGHFCSGGDINNMKAERTLAEGRERIAFVGKVARALMAGPKPIIAAVEGYAAGAGLSLAAGADYVVSSRTAIYVASFCKVGLIPDLGLLWSLTQRIGIGQAKRMIASARKVAAEEAFQLGIVDQLAEPGAALDDAIAIAREFCSGAPLPMAMVKAAYARGIGSLDDALDVELENQSALYVTSDHREAVSAFFEKRPPQFKGC